MVISILGFWVVRDWVLVELLCLTFKKIGSTSCLGICLNYKRASRRVSTRHARVRAPRQSLPGEFSHPEIAAESAHRKGHFVGCHGKAHRTDVLTNFRNRRARSVKMENG